MLTFAGRATAVATPSSSLPPPSLPPSSSSSPPLPPPATGNSSTNSTYQQPISTGKTSTFIGLPKIFWVLFLVTFFSLIFISWMPTVCCLSAMAWLTTEFCGGFLLQTIWLVFVGSADLST